MIHNPQVNADLQSHGVTFLQDTYGKQLIPFSTLTSDDIVIIPAFGTTLEIEKRLNDLGIPTEKYNTTCPFVEKVWNRSEVIAKKNYTIVIHGKPDHEETRATFSHAAVNAPSVVVKDMQQTLELAGYITGKKMRHSSTKNLKANTRQILMRKKILKRSAWSIRPPCSPAIHRPLPIFKTGDGTEIRR